ncbi:phage tail protein [Pseudomonas promysalinigenes]|uniref:phage tail protein n=1 Tax=Pseudomonas promysalinigenes TaxID=485898 RepID=UPI0037CC0DD8
MGPADHVDITGGKGGSSKPKTPVEAPDSLQSTNIAKVLLAVGEGEFHGVPTDRDIYLDNTPIMDASGNVNFPGVNWEWRPGSVEQEYIQGIPSVENETTVNVELRSDNPFTRALSNTQLSAVRVRMSWPRLAQQDSSGNTNGYRIDYAIDIATDGGAYVEAHLGAVDGKTTNGYQRSVRVNLPKATSGWMLRVRRSTPNANSGTVADTMTIAGYTEIIDQKLRYPNTALLYIEFDAQQFQNIPAVTVKCKAKRWPVPTNYDPIARTYTGVWDGTFKQAWTNNPAFVTYGVCVEDRFGLGKRIKSWMVDKWEMYRIAQYCDQQVPNGVGGQEPRFLCDMNLQGRAEAWTLLRDLSAIYRGMVYWAHGSLFMQADMPRAQDIDYVFTRANVIDGDFVYGGAERNTHYSRALVSYDNPANNYDTDVIPVTDNALQRRYRDRPVEISAIGCTRASEAQRRGKWALLSNSRDRTVTFKTGMEGRIPLPGYVIPVADELVAGRPNGGRISSAAGRVVTLDRDTPIKAGDRLILNLPNGTAQARTVQSVAGRAVTVTTAYSVQPEPELQWAIDYDDLAVQLFRVLKTVRTQEGEYEITALEFNPSKFAAIDTGAKLDERPISVTPVTTVQPPASVTLSSAHMIDQGIAVSTMTIAWPAVEGAVAYDVEWRKDNGNWVRLQRTGAASVDVVGIYAGAYQARVRAVSAFDITSIWKSSELTQLNGKEGLPPAVTFLNTESLLFGIKITWGFPAGAEDTQRTELWYSEGTDLETATKLSDLAYPQNEHIMQGLRAGQRFFFWARLVDRTGNLGPFYPVAPTVISGIASMDAGPILDQIKDQITESELGKELTDRIDLIDMDGPGSVNERLGEVRSDLNEQISDVNNHVNEVQNELQHQIDTIADLADSMPYKPDQSYTAGQSVLGEDGRLYQAKVDVPAGNSPPNATYWVDIGQAVQTANGMAARVQTVETKVQNLEGTSSAQAQQITGLQSSLTTTNGNVAAAQQAAQDAATLAGGKGKVIVQSAAPAAADRLAQNLWIDTTGNANTPKRWNGSAWVAVTDKVATDAAAAAANALAVAQTKADASVVQSLTTRVTDAEGALSSQGQAITGLNNSLTTTNQNVTAAQQAAQAAADAAGTKGKVLYQSTAPAVADRLTQNLWIDTTSNANTPKRWNGSAWVAVTDKVATDAAAAAANALNQVATKADASTVQVLSNTVDQHGTAITANGRALTSINASLSSLGASGVNLVPAEYCAFAKDLPANMYSNGGVAMSTVADASAFKGYALKAANSNVNSHTFGLNTGFTAAGCNMGFKPGKYLVSFYAKAEVAGHVVGAYARVLLADGVTFKTSNAPTFTLTTSWARYVGVIDLTDPSYNGTQMQLAVQSNRSGVANRVTYYDRFMLEAVVNDQVEPSTFSMGTSFDQSAVLAEANSALSGRVSRNEEGLTSTSSQLTQLKNSIGGSGVNLLPAEYSTFQRTLPPIDGSSFVASVENDSASFSGGSLKFTWATDSTGLSAFMSPKWNIGNMGMKAQKYIISYRARASADGHVVAFYLRGINPDGSVANSPAATQQPLTTSWARYSYVADLTGGSFTGDKMLLAAQMNRSGVAGRTVWFDQIMVEQVVGEGTAPSTFVPGNTADQSSASSSAIESLSSVVTQQGKDLTSVTSRTTLLEGSVNSATSGLATKASTSALQTLTGRVAATESGLTAANSSITRIGSQIDAIGGAGSNLIPAEFTSFGPSAPSLYKLAAMQVTTESDSAAYSGYLLKATVSGSAATGFMYLASAIADYNLRLKPGANYTFSVWAKGSAAHVVGVRLRFVSSSGSVTETVVGSVSVTTTLARQSVVITAPANLVSTCCVVLFTQNTAAVGTTWFDGFMLEAQVGASTEPSAFVPGPSNRQVAAQAIALDSLDTKVTQQGTRIEAEAKRTDGLYTSVGDANAAIQNEATARSNADTALGKRVDTVQSNLGSTNASVQQISTAQANLDGKVNATWSVKLGLTSGGSYYAAGFGLGLENQGGTFQSSFVVLANRFAVLNPVGEGLISPFAIQNGQVFISDALISSLSVQKAIVGNSINSSELANDGTPIMRMDFASGTMILINKTATAYTVYNRRGIDMVINGVRRIRMGEWD